MKRRIPLDADIPADRRQYTLLCNALTTRGSQSRDARTGELPRISKEDKRSDARIKQALWSLGEPDEKSEIPAPKGDEPDLRPLKLLGGTLTLDQPDWARLLTMVENSQWTLSYVQDGADLEDRMDAAEKITGEGEVEKPASHRKLKSA